MKTVYNNFIVVDKCMCFCLHSIILRGTLQKCFLKHCRIAYMYEEEKSAAMY